MITDPQKCPNCDTPADRLVELVGMKRTYSCKCGARKHSVVSGVTPDPVLTGLLRAAQDRHAATVQKILDGTITEVGQLG